MYGKSGVKSGVVSGVKKLVKVLKSGVNVFTVYKNVCKHVWHQLMFRFHYRKIEQTENVKQ